VLLLVTGLGIVAAVLAFTHDPHAAVLAEARSLAQRSGAEPTSVVTTAWPWLALIGGLAVVVSGLATMLRGRGWPVMGARYEAPGAPRRKRQTDRETAMWESFDRGEDPTVSRRDSHQGE
jgi:uncharacterized membrane protein (TIGR02234 family)